MSIDGEFREIAHCGGKFSIVTKTDDEGRRAFQVGVSSSNPTPASIFLINVLPQGIPIATVSMGWAPDQADEPPRQVQFYQIIIASDQQGMFGHRCYRCGGYWRSRSAPANWPTTCPYCGLRDATHNFLTDGQQAFVKKCKEICQHDVSSTARL